MALGLSGTKTERRDHDGGMKNDERKSEKAHRSGTGKLNGLTPRQELTPEKEKKQWDRQ